MPKLRPAQMRGPARKLTPQVLRENPLIARIARLRLKEIRAAREARKASELDLD
jgi:hypothetical protein